MKQMKRLKNTLLLFYIHDFLTYAQEITVDTLKLKNGNTFTIQVYNETYTYEVYDKAVVDPEDVSSLYIQPGKDIVTLITCTPYGVNTHRLLVFGKRVKDKDVESVLKQEPEISDSIEPQDILNIAFIFVCFLFFIIFLVLFIKRR